MLERVFQIFPNLAPKVCFKHPILFLGPEQSWEPPGKSTLRSSPFPHQQVPPRQEKPVRLTPPSAPHRSPHIKAGSSNDDDPSEYAFLNYYKLFMKKHELNKLLKRVIYFARGRNVLVFKVISDSTW